jgi:hypothetical protein
MRRYTNLFGWYPSIALQFANRILPHPLIIIFSLLPSLVISQEQVKLAFFKQGVVEYQITEKFGAKLPEAGIIGMLVPLPDSIEYCNKIPVFVHDKILLLRAYNGCTEEQACRIAAQSGAAAAIVIRNESNRTDYSGTPEHSVKIPCLVVSEGTGLYYRGLLKKPSLVSLSAAAYEGKVVTGQSPRVKNLYVDQNTAAFVKKSSTETTSPPPSPGSTEPYIAYSASSTSVKVGIPAEPAPVESIKINASSEAPKNSTLAVSNIPQAQLSASEANFQPVNNVINSKSPVEEKTVVTSTVYTSITSKNTITAPTESFRGTIDVFPIKVSEILLVSFDLEVNTTLNFVIINDKGERLKESVVEDAKIGLQEIEVSQLPAGNYEVVVTEGVNTFRKKIIVLH